MKLKLWKLSVVLFAVLVSFLVLATDHISKTQIKKCVDFLSSRDKLNWYKHNLNRLESLSSRASHLNDEVSANMEKALELKKKILDVKANFKSFDRQKKISSYMSPIMLPFYIYNHKRRVAENNKLRDELSSITREINKIEKSNRDSLEIVLLDHFENYKFHLLSEKNTALDASLIHSTYLEFISFVKDKSIDYLEELTYSQTEHSKSRKNSYFFLNSYVNENGDTVYFVECKIKDFIENVVEKHENLEFLLKSLPKNYSDAIQKLGVAYAELYSAISLNQEGYIGLEPMLVEKYIKNLKVVADLHNKNLHHVILNLSDRTATSHHINANMVGYGLVYVTYLNIYNILNAYNQAQREVLVQIYEKLTSEIKQFGNNTNPIK